MQNKSNKSSSYAAAAASSVEYMSSLLFLFAAFIKTKTKQQKHKII